MMSQRGLRRGLVATGRGIRMGGAFVARVTEPDPHALRRTVRVDPDWRAISDDGLARRLGPDATIEVARSGRWRGHDPLKVQTGWHESGRALGLGLWVLAIGAAWWAGRRGHGPLSMLEDRPW
jgi:hypothetical protein